MTQIQGHEELRNSVHLGSALGVIPEGDHLLGESLEISSYELGKSHYQLGKIYYDKSDLGKAETHFIKALSFTEEPRDYYSKFKILGFLIRIASEQLDDHKAGLYIQDADNIVEKMSTALGTLNAEYFYNVGIVNNYKGDFDQARIQFELAHKKSREENEPELLSKCLLSLAVNCFNRREFEKSLAYLEQLGELLTIIKKNYLSGARFLFAAKVYNEMDDSKKALDFYRLANQTLQGKKCWNLYGYILLGKGVVFKRNGQYDQALTFFELAKESTDARVFKRLSQLIDSEIQDVNDSSVDIYLDRVNRKIKERTLGTIDFKHRFILLEILFLLAKNAGSYFDKEQLAKCIWKDEYNPLIHDKLIYTSVSRLRKLIEPKNDSGVKRKYIVRGKDGYTFNPMVKIRFQQETKPQTQGAIGNIELGSPV